METKLWVLKYMIGELEIFLTPENQHSIHIKDALKFESEENCKNYITDRILLFGYVPTLDDIPDNGDKFCLQRGHQ